MNQGFGHDRWITKLSDSGIVWRLSRRRPPWLGQSHLIISGLNRRAAALCVSICAHFTSVMVPSVLHFLARNACASDNWAYVDL